MPVTQSGADIWFLRLLLPRGNRHLGTVLWTLIGVGPVSGVADDPSWESYEVYKVQL